MVPGWVYRVGRGRAIPGYYPASSKAEVPDSEAGPGSPTRSGVGGLGLQRPPGSRYHPCGARSACSLPVPGPSPLPASWPIRARFTSILLKVSQNDEVSPENVHKACPSPCFQNGVEKSPLDFLRFPYFVAFSRKELMGHFDPRVRVYVKMTKCRQMVHGWSAKGSVDTPTGHRSKLPLVTRSSSPSARAA